MKYSLTAPPSSTDQQLSFEIPDLPASITPVITGTTPIVVTPPPTNIAPTANAGSDIVIKLPTNSIVLNGSGNDPDGVIKTIQWVKLSGGTANIINPSSLVTQVTGLTQGSYSFQLSLTDDQGAIGTDTVNVTVQQADITTNTGTATGVSTFESIGIYWSGHGQPSTTICNLKYRKVGDTAWNNGLSLWCDTRAIGGRPANEFRGSIVSLTPGTQYEIQLTAGTASNTFTVSTWAEKFPELTAQTLSTSTNITAGGTAQGYKVFTGTINGGTNNLYINAPYVIIRNMVLTGAGEDAIVIGPNAHHVVIDNCDISGWGFVGMGSNNQAAVRIKGFSYNAANIKQIVVQNNFIHDSRDPGAGWDAGGTHPVGPNGINFEQPGGNNVIRYNTIKSNDPNKRFMDGIGGADNFTTTGFPGPDSDIYGNLIDGVWDDAIEVEGGGMNVRVWANFLNNTFTGVASATCSIGPLYIFRNISNVGQRLHGVSNTTLDTEDRGPFNKTGSQDATVRGGRIYLFHNTVLQPVQAGFANPRGLDGGIIDNGGPVTNVVSKNNIWTSGYTGKGGLPIAMWQGGGQNCTSENDLLSPNSTNGTFTITNRVTGNPTYANPITLTLQPLGYQLAPGSKGMDAGVIIPNFNDGFTGTAPDCGAQESGKPVINFGVNAKN